MIVVTTPTGNVGRHVLAKLLEADQPVRVIARDPDKLAPEVRDRVDVVQGSHSEAEVVDRAFAGARALFWLAPGLPFLTPDQAYVDFARPAADGIRRHGVKRVVSVSALGRGTKWEKNGGIVSAMLRMDEVLASSGAAMRWLAMPSFMDNTLHSFDTLRDQSKLTGPHVADASAPKAAVSDVGAVAARLLADESWTGQSEHQLIGSERLSMVDMAAIISEVLGREVPFEEVPYEAFRQQAVARGVSDAFAEGFVEMFRAKDQGMDAGPYRGDVEIAPTTYRQWCETVLKPMLAR